MHNHICRVFWQWSNWSPYAFFFFSFFSLFYFSIINWFRRKVYLLKKGLAKENIVDECSFSFNPAFCIFALIVIICRQTETKFLFAHFCVHENGGHVVKHCLKDQRRESLFLIWLLLFSVIFQFSSFIVIFFFSIFLASLSFFLLSPFPHFSNPLFPLDL